MGLVFITHEKHATRRSTKFLIENIGASRGGGRAVGNDVEVARIRNRLDHSPRLRSATHILVSSRICVKLGRIRCGRRRMGCCGFRVKRTGLMKIVGCWGCDEGLRQACFGLAHGIRILTAGSGEGLRDLQGRSLRSRVLRLAFAHAQPGRKDDK